MPKRIDNNQPEIVRMLREVGASVAHTHMVGKGFPDIVVGFRGKSYLMEIKDGNKNLTLDERQWHDEWRGQVFIVRSTDEALRVIGAIQ